MLAPACRVFWNIPSWTALAGGWAVVAAADTSLTLWLVLPLQASVEHMTENESGNPAGPWYSGKAAGKPTGPGARGLPDPWAAGQGC